MVREREIKKGVCMKCATDRVDEMEKWGKLNEMESGRGVEVRPWHCECVMMAEFQTCWHCTRKREDGECTLFRLRVVDASR